MSYGDTSAATVTEPLLGKRIRIWTKNSYRWTGRVIDESDYFITLDEEIKGTSMKFSRDWIMQIETLDTERKE